MVGMELCVGLGEDGTVRVELSAGLMEGGYCGAELHGRLVEGVWWGQTCVLIGTHPRLLHLWSFWSESNVSEAQSPSSQHFFTQFFF